MRACLAGEINTLRGNSNWMTAREGVMACAALNLPEDMLDALSPVVPAGSSDTGAFDSVLELLTHCGRDIAEVRVVGGAGRAPLCVHGVPRHGLSVGAATHALKTPGADGAVAWCLVRWCR